MRRIKFAIDVSWLRPGKIGGIESYVRNLLDGFLQSDRDGIEIVLVVGKDNKNTFEKYDKDFDVVVCPHNSVNNYRMLLWTGLFLDRFVSTLDVNFCFVPSPRMPWFRPNNKYVITIHDLQALHYPEYFSKLRNLWFKFNWNRLVVNSYRIVGISDFVKEDVISRLSCDPDKITTIYNPIDNLKNFCDFETLQEKYGIKEKSYFYTISSLLRHKNTTTLLKVMRLLKDGGSNIKLLISGIKGDYSDYIYDYVKKYDLSDVCVFTGFVSNEERNTLLKHAQFFLFSSVFEGFGMPVIEAMRLGTKVITTRCASIEEVSQSKAIYVNNPFDEKEWIEKIKENESLKMKPEPFQEYNCEVIAKQYLDYFKSIV